MILGMGTRKLKRSVEVSDFVKMFFEVLSGKSPFEFYCKAPVLCSLSGGMCVG